MERLAHNVLSALRMTELPSRRCADSGRRRAELKPIEPANTDHLLIYADHLDSQ